MYKGNIKIENRVQKYPQVTVIQLYCCNILNNFAMLAKLSNMFLVNAVTVMMLLQQKLTTDKCRRVDIDETIYENDNF